MDNSVIVDAQPSYAAEQSVDVFSNTKLFKPEKSSRAKKIKRLKANLTGWGFALWPLYTYAVFALVGGHIVL